MAYKCIPFSGGVDVSVNESNYFTFRSQTHNLINTGNGNVRIQRKIDMLFEVLDTPITDFVDTNENVIATTFAQLSTYFLADRNVMAGEGVSVVNGTVSIVAGGPSTLGGFKVGTGLTVDGSGRLSASATSEITRVLNTEAEMLALPVEELRSYRVIRLDTKRLYYTNAGATPSVLGNWFVGPSIEAAVLSFKGRTGVIEPALGDYNFDLVTAVDKTTSAGYKLVVDAGKLYIQNTGTSDRVEISYATEMGEISSKITALEDLVSSPTGLVSKVESLEVDVSRNTDIISNSETGLVTRVQALEDAPTPEPGGNGTDYGPQIQALQNKDVAQDAALKVVDDKVDSVANNNTTLDMRLTTLEDKPASKDFSTDIQALKDKNVSQDAKLIQLDAALLTTVKLGPDGKVPSQNLPDTATAKKVTVANRAARLALPYHNDLTIAYESDTADAWALNKDEDPAVAANWSPLGNSKASGVLTWNSRTGSVLPQTGDYNTSQITELGDKRFVSTTQMAAWDGKETTVGSQDKATAVKTYADATFLTKSQRNAVNGIAPLDATGKVPLANLPEQKGVGEMVIPVTKYVNIGNLKSQLIWYPNPTKYDRRVQIWMNYVVGTNVSFLEVRDESNGFIYKIDSTRSNSTANQVIDAVVPAGMSYRLTLGAANRSIDNWYELETVAGSTFTPISEKGVANGVAPLGSDAKVPLANLPPLGDVMVPSTLYRDRSSERTPLVWYTNESVFDKNIQVWMNYIAGATASYIEVLDPVSKVTYTINASVAGGNIITNHVINATVPPKWQYRLTVGSGTGRKIETWYELDHIISSTFTPVSEKGKANGVAALDANGKVPLINLPTGLPQATRIWRDVKETRKIATWATNTSGNEMVVYLRSDQSTAATRYIQAVIRKDASDDTGLTFASDATAATSNRRHTLTLFVPAGWQYIVVTTGGSTDAATQYWYEMS